MIHLYDLKMKKALPFLAIILALSGCSENQTTEATEKNATLLDQQVGAEVTVFLKRNELGMSRELPLSADSTGLNGGMVVLKGDLLEIGDGAIILDVKNSEEKSWIPYHSILHITFR